MQPDVSAVEAGQGSKYSWCCKHKANGRHVHIHTGFFKPFIYTVGVQYMCGEISTTVRYRVMVRGIPLTTLN